MALPSVRIQLFATDLDGTLLGDDESEKRFLRVWNSLDPKSRPILVYNTGRSIANTRGLVEREELPRPDYIIGGVGTELCDSFFAIDPSFARRFGAGWDLQRIERILGAWPGIERQPPEFLHAHKSSWYWPDAPAGEVARLRNSLAEAGLSVNVVYSSDRYLDVLPIDADKGTALHWLCERLGVPLRNVLVAGDTGNDASMFQLPWVWRILVSNALPELYAEAVGRAKFLAARPMADGVLQGLRHFGVLSATHPLVPDLP